MLNVLDKACTQWGMKINGDKTKVLNIGELRGDHPQAAITLNGHALEDLESFPYLGSEVDQTVRIGRERWESGADWRRQLQTEGDQE
jgi:hypothetical protein